MVLPHVDAVPPGDPLPIDGVWRLEQNQVLYRLDRGRISAAQNWYALTIGQVVTKELRQTGPRSFEAFDLALNGRWEGTLEDDGTLSLVVHAALGPQPYQFTPVSLDDPEWMRAQLASDRVQPRPGAVTESLAAGGLPTDPSVFGRYHALVIGNNAYRHLTPLRTAVADAEAVSALLRDRYGFEVETLLDADREEILLAFAGLRKRLGADDNLLIYYAGHGWLDESADEGYWLPVDATPDNDLRWISNATITSHFRALKAKHVLVIADSCFSGTLTRGVRISSGAQADLERMSRRKARVVLSSGGEEPVSDGTGRHSAFATVLIDTLSSNREVLDASTLYAMIRRPVMLAADQAPDLADIREAGHDGGDFLFVPVRR
jgi:hypothetical protein